jgi:DNA-directed RNA polymerase specialized sigma24 family protein
MRQTVIDHARERLAEKRGGGLLRTQLDEGIADSALDSQQVLAIEQALTGLDAQDPELAETFTWRVFAGLTAAQLAELRGVTERTVQRDLGLARNYLRLRWWRSVTEAADLRLFAPERWADVRKLVDRPIV